METIDLTPTWGELGLLIKRLLTSREEDALKHMLPEMAHAFASAQALRAILDTLDDKQHDIVAKVLVEELKKQGH